MCGDLCCPSCGPAQGNWKCPICGTWASETCEHIGEDGKLLSQFVAQAEAAAKAEADAEAAAYDAAEKMFDDMSDEELEELGFYLELQRRRNKRRS
jgi:uncharacterized Zn finger protein (UPF0148 family)